MHIWQLSDINVTERLVASIVYGFTDQGKPCFMTNTGFSELLRISKRSAQRAVNSLIEKGHLEHVEGRQQRQLMCRVCLGGVDTSVQGGESPVSIRNIYMNKEPNKEHNKMEEEKKPIHWQQVRDYFTWINDKERGNNSSHVISWAKDFFTYYDARNWRNKNGAITRWKPVAEAWYRRSAKKVPQRAVINRDDVQLRSDIRWHRKRAAAYSKNPEKAHLVKGELLHAQQLEEKLLKGGR
tara:strand:+ start:8399 stop:9115 length:717 start_codon:yes stop_codon:yes gene_type:complete